MKIKTTVFGYPRIGPKRELKKALEDYWNGKISKVELLETANSLIIQNAKVIQSSGVDLIPSNEFSLYDFILDHSVMFNAVPQRFNRISDPLDRYFAMARGTQELPALEMTKWFNTNYHYIVPEIEDEEFELVENKPLREFALLRDSLSVKTKPVIVGPFTYLKSAKLNMDRVERLSEKILPAYKKLLIKLDAAGVEEIQIDEPAMVMDMEEREIELLTGLYRELTKGLTLKVYLQTYYEAVSAYEKLVFSLSVHGFGFDLLDGKENLENILTLGFPSDKVLIAGVVSGRDPWRTDFTVVMSMLERLFRVTDKIMLSNSSPLIHLPITVEAERGHIQEDILNMLSFANERLEELTILKRAINDGAALPARKSIVHEIFSKAEVRSKISSIDEKAILRKPEFKERYSIQMDSFKLPLFPTTTIGSFPQTKEVRKFRADYKNGKITEEEYKKFIFQEIEKAVKIQEELDIDVLVHGEFERTDMVEFFAEKLKGFAITKNGWVQSYGSRCVRPPVIYGDVWRDKALTVEETLYAQSLTTRPVKGIMTGAVTILQWSYPRRDISRREIAYQIALALKEEVLELEKRGIKIIQIDEPAFREGLPLKRNKQNEYFDWAINSFRLTTADVSPFTQIHTHMCYSDFNEIIDRIYVLDADVISIEASRSKGEILSAFENFRYDHGIGLGVYDIHSPRVPSVEEMIEIIERSVSLIDKSLFWINPDCGLKTRGWQETVASLKNMVLAAKAMRKREV
ncbi:5-methyltetrahydropteroyltriglutamate--homocysteine S-methyltransferase [Thermodesulfovibrio yellowstonii]|uniref:5-methyltetrahydropteroyltriglutamate-- homocysteine S-methyltransferase n=1 Tax=Thermodesulfovibrio yellowstonii TaxID=28262 RepID=UPI000423079F|nr:5-methyltetrahydropteroyltriglutamate--homocysteine S-methyltransferase [Thermodesulfovibrio islandicus]